MSLFATVEDEVVVENIQIGTNRIPSLRMSETIPCDIDQVASEPVLHSKLREVFEDVDRIYEEAVEEHHRRKKKMAQLRRRLSRPQSRVSQTKRRAAFELPPFDESQIPDEFEEPPFMLHAKFVFFFQLGKILLRLNKHLRRLERVERTLGSENSYVPNKNREKIFPVIGRLQVQVFQIIEKLLPPEGKELDYVQMGSIYATLRDSESARPFLVMAKETTSIRALQWIKYVLDVALGEMSKFQFVFDEAVDIKHVWIDLLFRTTDTEYGDVAAAFLQLDREGMTHIWRKVRADLDGGVTKKPFRFTLDFVEMPELDWI